VAASLEDLTRYIVISLQVCNKFHEQKNCRHCPRFNYSNGNY